MKKVLNEFEVFLGTICTIAMVCILFVNVIGRYVLSHSLKWGEEVCLMLFILSIYFGACGAIRTRQHLRLEIVLGKLKPKARMIMEIVNNAIFAMFNGIILFGIMPLVMQLYRTKTAAAVTGIPKYLIYMWLPIMFVLMVVRLVQDCILRYKEYLDDPDGSKKAEAERKAMESMLLNDEEEN
ncbi:MAG: TRAP transporter small permease [Anaerotruncus sp.]|nr:TRAP transporter small permease [Anaerotruncus sp.]